MTRLTARLLVLLPLLPLGVLGVGALVACSAAPDDATASLAPAPSEALGDPAVVAPRDGVTGPSAEHELEAESDPPFDVEDAEETLRARATNLPRGAFASVQALCVAEKARVLPTLAAASAALSERMGEEAKLTPSCAEDDAALRHAHVRLAAPFAEVRAVTYETGFATATSLVVRTRAGWVPMEEPILSDEHDDPGCPSIEREMNFEAVHVEAGKLLVLSHASRGLGDRDLVLTHARACTLADDHLTCGEPVTVEARAVPWATDDDPVPGPAKVLFRTAYRVASDGSIRADRAWSDDLVE